MIFESQGMERGRGGVGARGGGATKLDDREGRG